MKTSKAFISQTLRHRMSGNTSINDGHRHAFNNFTGMFIRDDGSHRHAFSGTTAMADGHRHRYSGVTGLAIGTGINHFHRFRISTAIVQGHRHIISGRTTGLVRVNGISGHRLIVEKVVRVRA